MFVSDSFGLTDDCRDDRLNRFEAIHQCWLFPENVAVCVYVCLINAPQKQCLPNRVKLRQQGQWKFWFENSDAD